MNGELIIEAVKEWPEDGIVELYRAGGWWKEDYDPSGIQPMIKGSFLFVIARIDDMTVGMGRAISDGVSDAYIQDVVVLPEYRKKGIGGKIIKMLVDKCREKGLVWIGLIAEEGSEDLYKEMGFGPFPGTPMLFRMGD